MKKILLIPATSHDIATIYNLAVKIWNYHYVPIIGKEQVDFMLQNMYSEKALVEQMQVKKHQFYIVNHDENTIGYISISGTKDVFIHKFYIDQDVQSKGIGTDVFNAIKKINQTAKTYKLTVNRKNFTAINFYFKNGFKIESIKDFDIGGGYIMNDFVMVKTVF